MRFHVGFSFGWKEIKKLIIPILIAVAVFFGLKEVNALEISFTSSNVSVVFSECDGDYNSCVNYISSVYSVPTNNQIVLKYPEFSIQNSPYSYMSISKYSGISAINFEVNGLNLVANNQYRVKVNMSFSSTNGIRRIFNQNQIVNFTTNGTTAKNYTYKSNDNNSFYIYFTPAINSTKIYFSMYSLMSGSGSENEFLIYNKGICDSIIFSNGCSNNFNNITMNFTSPTVELVSEDPIQGGLNNLDNSISNQTTIIQGNQQETMGKLDELKDKFEDIFNSCSLKKELFYYPSDVVVQDYYLGSDGNHVVDVGSGITNYISVLSDTTYNIVPTSDALNLASFCLYDSSKNLISCEQFKQRTNITFNTNKAKYIRITITSTNARPLTLSHNVCKNKIDSTNDKLDDLENTITDDSIDDNSGFFTDFDENDFGLSDIVKAPLILIRGLSNGGTCQDLQFNVLGADVSLPSGCILWDKVPDSIETIYNIFIGGFFAYILGTKLFHDVNDLKDPQKNEVSTLDL